MKSLFWIISNSGFLKKIFFKTGIVLCCLFFNNIYSQQARNIDSLLNIISKNPHDTIKANCYNYLSQEFLNTDAQKAKLYVQNALDLSKKNNYKKGLAFSYHLMGTIYYQSNIDKGLEYFMLSINASKEINDKHTMSSTYNNLGNLYNQKGDYEKALKYYLISLGLDEELNNRSGMASSYNNVGLIYWMQSNFDKAQEYFEKSLHIYKNLNKKDGIAAAYSNIGGVAYYKDKKDVALNFFYKAYEIYSEVDNKSGCATSLANISEILIEQKKYAEAIEICFKAIALQELLGNKSDMVYTLLSIAKNYVEQAKYVKAIEVLNNAIQLSKELNAQLLLSKSYLLMADVNEKANNYIEALKYHKLHIAVNDSLFTKESNAQIAEMNAKYENDKKNKEIELLTKEKEIQELNQDVERGRNLMIRNILIVGLIFIFILAFVLYNRTKVKQRANNILSEKNKNIEDQKVQIEIQHALLEQKNKDITDSIKYAQRLQNAIIPPPKKVNEKLPESFVLFKPKDIVSGDFYWLEAIDNFVLFAAADCTGHGVPGAFMSIIGNNLLNQAVKIYGNIQPSLILDNVNENLSVMLNQPQSTNSIKDGMDISLCKLEKSKSGIYNLEWAGANNPLWIIRSANNTTNANNENALELFEFVPDKQPVGTFVGEELKPFTNQSVEIKKGETVYLFTDGFPDQFGGPKGKKYKYAQFKKTLQKINSFSMQEQRSFLENELKTWMGELEQVDDILIIGFRV
jgi:tetratricopeptide (TPR) repeat protein